MTDSKDKKKRKISIKEENQKLKQLLKEKDEKILRNLADFQNYQKRINKELNDIEKEIKNKFFLKFIDIYELLVQVYNDKNPKFGLKLIINDIENFFKKENIQYIDCIGKKFDHNVHHAISTIEKDDCKENTVVEEIKKGYVIEDRLLRPSHVVVAKRKEKE
jgi:molecular chaperone GrpE